MSAWHCSAVYYLFIFVDVKGVVYSGSGDVFDGKLYIIILF
jgi:hypothetical protein